MKIVRYLLRQSTFTANKQKKIFGNASKEDFSDQTVRSPTVTVIMTSNNAYMIIYRIKNYTHFLLN